MNLTTKQIKESFPEECVTLVPKLLRARRRQMDRLENTIQDLRVKYDEHMAQAITVGVHGEEGRGLEKDIRRLKRIIYYREAKKTDSVVLDIEGAKLVPIESLYSFEKVKRMHNRVHCACPLHAEKTPSFVIYPNNTFHCFSCKAGSSSIDFIMALNGCNFKEAVNFINGG